MLGSTRWWHTAFLIAVRTLLGPLLFLNQDPPVSLALSLSLLLAATGDAPPPASSEIGDAKVETVEPADGGLVWQQVIIEQQIIIRVPARSRITSFSPASPGARGPSSEHSIVWKERDAAKCLPMKSVLGVQVSRDDSIDLLTSERQRLRAKLDDNCRTEDFYSGFYMQKGADGMLCEDRDEIQARSGAKCTIESFRLMVPVAIKD